MIFWTGRGLILQNRQKGTKPQKQGKNRVLPFSDNGPQNCPATSQPQGIRPSGKPYRSILILHRHCSGEVFPVGARSSDLIHRRVNPVGGGGDHRMLFVFHQTGDIKDRTGMDDQFIGIDIPFDIG